MEGNEERTEFGLQASQLVREIRSIKEPREFGGRVVVREEGRSTAVASCWLVGSRKCSSRRNGKVVHRKLTFSV